MTASLVLLLAARTVNSPFTCNLLALAKVDSELTGVAMNDPQYEAALVAYFDELAQRYSPGSFRREVKRVVLVRDLSYRGQIVNGLSVATKRTFALCVDRGGFPMSKDNLIRALHHETAHLLLGTYPKRFPKRAWNRANDSGFHYRYENGFTALAQNDSSEVKDPVLNAQGLLHNYGASCYDEDVASMAEELLLPYDGEEKALCDLAARYPRLATKFELLTTFYRKIFKDIWFPELPKAPARSKSKD